MHRGWVWFIVAAARRSQRYGHLEEAEHTWGVVEGDISPVGPVCRIQEQRWNAVFIIMLFSLPNPTIVVFSLLYNEVFEFPEGVSLLSWSPACCTAQSRRTKHRSRDGTSHFSCFQQPLKCTTGHILLSEPSRVQESSNRAAPELDRLSVFSPNPTWARHYSSRLN